MAEGQASIDLNEQQLTLLHMMYNGDIDSSKAVEALGVPIEELYKIVDELIQLQMLIASGDEEVELTESGVSYIEEKMKKSSEDGS